MALIERCANLCPEEVASVEAATKHALRAIARRRQQVDAEIKDHEKLTGELAGSTAPQLVAALGIGADTAAAHRH